MPSSCRQKQEWIGESQSHIISEGWRRLCQMDRTVGISTRKVRSGCIELVNIAKIFSKVPGLKRKGERKKKEINRNLKKQEDSLAIKFWNNAHYLNKKLSTEIKKEKGQRQEIEGESRR